MKVGAVIVSDLNHNNYGSALQAYATIKIVKNFGHDLTIIKYKKQRSITDWIKIAPGLLLSGGVELIKKKIKARLLKRIHVDYAHNLQIRFNATNAFKEKEFVPLFREYKGYQKLCEGSKSFDLVFVGSDQVWRPYGFYSNYWNLNFADDNVPKFSYSSSYGVSQIPFIQKSGTRKYLERLDMISVREKKAKEIVENLSSKKATVVADPTMLLSREEWLAFAEKSKMVLPSEPYIFCYFLGPRRDIREQAMNFAKKKRMKILCMPHMEEYRKQDLCFGDIVNWEANAYDFVNIINHAAYVCTDSFHGTVFSIILHKKFFTFYRAFGQSTNSRIDSLLSIFNLTERICYDSIQDEDKTEIDYLRIDAKMIEYRSQSMAFLEKALALSKTSK